MSKQKCRLSKKRSKFCIIPNAVAQGLNYCLEALGLYVYIFSLPDEWEFYKSHLKTVCKVSEKKLNNMLDILAQHNLIKVAQIRDEKGQFAHFDIQIDDGTSFKIIDLEKSAQPDVQKAVPVTSRSRSKMIYKEHIPNKDDNIKNKDKDLCANHFARNRFDEFWSVYPRKKDKARAEQIWESKKLDAIADEIIADVKNRLLNDRQWDDEQYIPYPSRYLKYERWKDQIELKVIPSSGKFNPIAHVINDLKGAIHE